MAKVKMETKLVVPANILWDAIGRFGALETGTPLWKNAYRTVKARVQRAS